MLRKVLEVSLAREGNDHRCCLERIISVEPQYRGIGYLDTDETPRRRDLWRQRQESPIPRIAHVTMPRMLRLQILILSMSVSQV